MTSSAERQRKRRERLRRQGFVDVTVCVPEDRKAHLRDFARHLSADGPSPSTVSRLIAAITALKELRDELKQRGIRHAGIFGSTARGDNKPESDIDVVIAIDEEHVGDVLDLVEIAGKIKRAVQARCAGAKVDVADLHMLKPRIRDAVEREAIYAF